MTINISPLTPGFVTEIGDVDLSQPLSPSEVDEIKQAFWDYAVLIFPCTMHRGAAFDDLRWRREMHRATVSDIANTCEQEKLEPAATR